MEQCVYLEGNSQAPRGQPFTTGPGTYKIPSSSDIPVQLNVSLMDRTPNPKAIFSSKVTNIVHLQCWSSWHSHFSGLIQGVGEPPLFLAASVFFAIKEAVASARKARGYEGAFLMNSPATCERIRMACSDQFTQLVSDLVYSVNWIMYLESPLRFTSSTIHSWHGIA